MLGKLIKNDMKSAARGVSNIYIAMAVVIAVMGASLFFDMNAGKAFSSLALISVSLIAIVVTIAATLGDFRKTVFGDRGYLTNTLPVKGPALLFSKWLTSMVWITISYLLVFFCMWLVYYYWTGEDANSSLTMFLQVLPEVGLPTADILLKTIALIAVKGILLITVFVLEVFFAVTLSNVSPFHKLGGVAPVLYFFGIFGIITFCSSRLERVFTSALLINADGQIVFSADQAVIDSIRMTGGASVTLTQIYVQAIAALLLFVITAELLDRKVNIK